MEILLQIFKCKTTIRIVYIHLEGEKKREWSGASNPEAQNLLNKTSSPFLSVRGVVVLSIIILFCIKYQFLNMNKF